jgi:hypothetical protein
MTELTDLQQIFPLTKTVLVQNEQVEVKPYKFRQILKAFGYLSEIVAELGYIPDITNAAVAAVFILGALGKHPDEIIGLLKLATNRDDSFFDEISAEEGLDLAMATWEVNKDFFTQKLKAKIESFGLLPPEKTPETPQSDKPESTEKENDPTQP